MKPQHLAFVVLIFGFALCLPSTAAALGPVPDGLAGQPPPLAGAPLSPDTAPQQAATPHPILNKYKITDAETHVVYLPLVMQNYQPFAILAITAGGSSANGSHTCALTGRGGVKCWGANAYGQLGDGTRTTRLTPVDVAGLTSGVTAISAGGGSTCALTELGGVKCWGSDPMIQSLIPKDIAGLTSGVKAISNSPNHACALTNAGGVKCWGANDYGQLGDGTKTRRAAPVDVIGLTEGIKAISSGYWHTCALTINGAVKCWGSHPGNGMAEDVTTPVDVSGLSSGVIAVSAGGAHTCAILSGGVKCWGAGGDGKLGNGTNTTSLAPVDVINLAGPVISLSAKYWHTCAVINNGLVQCWGNNSTGQIGDGTTANRTIPTNASGLGSETVAVTAGHLHTCALFIGSHVKCWGANGAGQLGDDTTTSSLTPVDVVGLIPAP